ncbi:hypothetical protein CF328_g9188, partial [Tilletia controversa]
MSSRANDARNNDDEDEQPLVQVFGEPTCTPLGWALPPGRMVEAAELSIRLFNEGQPDVTARIHAIYTIHLAEEKSPLPAIYRNLEVSTDRLDDNLSDELILVHNLLQNWNETHERITRVPWDSENEDGNEDEDGDGAEAHQPLVRVHNVPPESSGQAEKRRKEDSPPPHPASPEKRGRVDNEGSPPARPSAGQMRGPTDGKRKAVSILKGVSSSEGAGSLRPPKRTVKKVVDLEFVHLWLLSKEACRRAAEKDTGFKKPMGFTSNGTFVDEDESRPDGYIPEGNLDWLLWGQCTTMQETVMAEHGVDAVVREMFKAAHYAIYHHPLAESQRAALQRYYAWNRKTWCDKYQLISSTESGDPIFDLAVVDSKDLDVYVREEEQRARAE